MNKTMSGVSIFLIVFIVLLGIFVFTKREADLKESSADWSSVEGMVSSREVKREWDKNSGSPVTRYHFNINYNYKVKDQTYVGTRYQFHGDPIFKSQTVAEKLVSDYPVGKSIKVYYNPNNPQQSVLIR